MSAYTEDDSQPDKDVHVRDHFDRMTRAYLRSVLSDEVIEEHRSWRRGPPERATVTASGLVPAPSADRTICREGRS